MAIIKWMKNEIPGWTSVMARKRSKCLRTTLSNFKLFKIKNVQLHVNLAKTVTEICSFCSASVYSTHKMKHWCCKVNPIRTVAKTLILIKQRGTKRLMLINLWRPHGGGRSQAQVDACGRGRGISVMWTSTQKFRAHWRHPVFFSCKEVGIFYQNFAFGWNKKWKFFIDIN